MPPYDYACAGLIGLGLSSVLIGVWAGLSTPSHVFGGPFLGAIICIALCLAAHELRSLGHRRKGPEQ
jgi:hypothetical protein